jgi:hypothetical protein
MTEQYATDGLVSVLTAGQIYAAIAAGALAFWMDRNAVNADQLAAAQPCITRGRPLRINRLGRHGVRRTDPQRRMARHCRGLRGPDERGRAGPDPVTGHNG